MVSLTECVWEFQNNALWDLIKMLYCPLSIMWAGNITYPKLGIGRVDPCLWKSDEYSGD